MKGYRNASLTNSGVSCVIMAVNAWRCGLLECANYGPAPPTSALKISVRVTAPLASSI